uniref:Midnolin n=1 Tax=Pavo cristatus TaxID=9049 RepID=A0A8C9FE26_PAVCR
GGPTSGGSRGESRCSPAPGCGDVVAALPSSPGGAAPLCPPHPPPPAPSNRGAERRALSAAPGAALTSLLSRSRLSSGKLQDLGVVEGSKLTLVPTVEAGLMSQASRPEQSVMQALESLTETQVNDFLSGRSPLTLALRVGDHMMFVQLQLAAQQSSGQLQHRHVIASRGEAGAANSPHCRTLPTPATPAPPVYCNAPHPAPVTAGMFRSHGASAQTVNSSVDCSMRGGSSPSSSPAPSARSRKPGAVIESFVNHAPGVFSGTFSGTCGEGRGDARQRPPRSASPAPAGRGPSAPRVENAGPRDGGVPGTGQEGGGWERCGPTVGPDGGPHGPAAPPAHGRGDRGGRTAGLRCGDGGTVGWVGPSACPSAPSPSRPGGGCSALPLLPPSSGHRGHPQGHSTSRAPGAVRPPGGAGCDPVAVIWGGGSRAAFPRWGSVR